MSSSALLVALVVWPLVGALAVGLLARTGDRVLAGAGVPVGAGVGSGAGVGAGAGADGPAREPGPGGRDRTAKLVALGVSVVELVLAALTWAAYSTADAAAGARLQLESSASWIPALGVHFSLGVDGIALVMVALIAVLVPIVLGSSWRPGTTEGELPGAGGGFAALVLAMEGLMVAVFLATDVFLFYVAFEAMLIPMYFLIGRFGGGRRQFAAMKFFLYSLLGGFVMLASVIGLYAASVRATGTGTFDWRELVALAPQFSTTTQTWLFLGFFVAFAIKAPLVPLHTWLPDAGAEAPVGAGVLLVGVLDKVGIYGFLRYCLPLFPEASRTLAPVVLVLAVLGVLYGALVATGQSDMKRFVAYTSIAHFGFIAVGVFAFTTQSATGAVLYMVNHGISTGLLLLVVGMVVRRGGSRHIRDYSGLARSAPLLAGAFLLAGLSSLALPGTNSFVSEFLVLLGSFPTQPVFSVLATVGIVLAALYVLWVYQRVMQGPEGGAGVETARTHGRLVDLSGLEKVVLAPLLALVVVLGFYPGPVLDVITPSVEATLTELGVPGEVVAPAPGTAGPAAATVVPEGPR
ncbi:NADH-quinone oxidoreductase subunit M [Rhodococcus aerolatus]